VQLKDRLLSSHKILTESLQSEVDRLKESSLQLEEELIKTKSCLLDRENRITELQNKLFLSEKSRPSQQEHLFDEQSEYDSQLTQLKSQLREIYQEK
jgi:multidrug efflux pump subunit AcrA (membrane-fusion protein)